MTVLQPDEPTILGISAFYHDSAAALTTTSRIVAAAQEERFTRVKGDSSFPHHAIDFCLGEAGVSEDEVDHVVFYENHLEKFERLLTTYHKTAPRSLRSCLRALPAWLTDKLWMEQRINREMGTRRRIHFCDHHLSHAASAFYPSPFDEAAILTIDGVGEWTTTAFGTGSGNRIALSRHQRFPNSLGLLYSAFTHYAGFKINSGEYKLMGLAPYGEPRYRETILRELAHIAPDGSLALNQRYFDYVFGLSMTNERFHRLFGGPPRTPESPITQKEMDIAASIQSVLNDALIAMARHVRTATGLGKLVMAGGVALNVVATGILSREEVFDEIWIQPAAGDAGGALGAALWMRHHLLDIAREADRGDSMRGAFLGLEISPQSDRDDETLARLGATWTSQSAEALQSEIARAIADGLVVGLARGRAEFGPRALGARSILGDARLPRMQSHMNLKIKFRESFRPFAPMVLEHRAADYFEARDPSPYMLFAYPVRKEVRTSPDDDGLWGIDRLNRPRSTIPAVTHIDYSARLQTVDHERNPFMFGVLSKFEELTGCPVIVNTSFNVRGEPIVNTVEDAYRCFMATEIDCLAVGDRWLRREEQRNHPLDDDARSEWLRRFDLD